jgi:glycine cleavage system H protein
MNVPAELEYTKSHEWVRREKEGSLVTVGITDRAQDELGDVVFVELPKEGAEVEAGEPFGTIESVKAVADLYAPVGGEVVEVNSSLNDSPERINQDPYGGGWIAKLRVEGEGELLSPEEYEKLV